jgi:hypothetical protein
VFLWVAVDVGDQVVEVAFGGDGDAAKRPLKQRPRPSIAVIKSAGVGVEEVGEELMRPVGLRILSICSSMCSPLDLTGLGGVWSCCVFIASFFGRNSSEERFFSSEELDRFFRRKIFF